MYSSSNLTKGHHPSALRPLACPGLHQRHHWHCPFLSRYSPHLHHFHLHHFDIHDGLREVFRSSCRCCKWGHVRPSSVARRRVQISSKVKTSNVSTAAEQINGDPGIHRNSRPPQPPRWGIGVGPLGLGCLEFAVHPGVFTSHLDVLMALKLLIFIVCHYERIRFLSWKSHTHERFVVQRINLTPPQMDIDWAKDAEEIKSLLAKLKP